MSIFPIFARRAKPQEISVLEGEVLKITTVAVKSGDCAEGFSDEITHVNIAIDQVGTRTFVLFPDERHPNGLIPGCRLAFSLRALDDDFGHMQAIDQGSRITKDSPDYRLGLR